MYVRSTMSRLQSCAEHDFCVSALSHNPFLPDNTDVSDGSNQRRNSVAACRPVPVNDKMPDCSTPGSVNIWRNLLETFANRNFDVWSWCPSTSIIRSARGSGWQSSFRKSSQQVVWLTGLSRLLLLGSTSTINQKKRPIPTTKSRIELLD